MLLFAHQASDALRTTPIVKSTRSQPPLVFHHSGQAKRRNGSIQAVPDNVIIDDLIQGSANAAAVVGKVGWEGVKLFGTGVKVAAPVIGQGVKLTIETATPVVRDALRRLGFKEDSLLKVVKSVYGLRSAAKSWYSTFRVFMESMKFKVHPQQSSIIKQNTNNHNDGD